VFVLERRHNRHKSNIRMRGNNDDINKEKEYTRKKERMA